MVDGKKTGHQKEKVFITSSSAYVTVIQYEVKSGRYDFYHRKPQDHGDEQDHHRASTDLQTDTPLKFTLTKPLASVTFDGVIVTDPAMAAQLRSAPEVLTRDVLLREQEQEAAARAETELAEAAAAQEAAKREAAEAREAEEVAKQAGAEAKRLAAAHEKEAAEAAQASAAAATATTLAAKERSEADDATRKRKLAQTKYTKEKGEAVEAAKLAEDQANLKATLTKCCGGVFLCLVPMLAAYQ